MAYIPPSDLSDTRCEKSEAHPETFARRLRCVLDIRYINLSSLSKMTGIRQDTIERYANGELEPTPSKLEQIAKALDVNEPWLMGRSVPRTKYDGTPEAFDTSKPPDDKNRRSKVVNVLYNQMEVLSRAKDVPDDLTDLCNLSFAMAQIAKAISYLEK